MDYNWVEFLKVRRICSPDVFGNMPCDNGLMCDKCHASYIQEDYKKWKEKLRVEK